MQTIRRKWKKKHDNARLSRKQTSDSSTQKQKETNGKNPYAVVVGRNQQSRTRAQIMRGYKKKN